jgi:hypothetical protein
MIRQNDDSRKRGIRHPQGTVQDIHAVHSRDWPLAPRRTPFRPDAARTQASAGDKWNPHRQLWQSRNRAAPDVHPIPRTHRYGELIRHNDRMSCIIVTTDQTIKSVLGLAETSASSTLASHRIRHFAGPERNVIAHLVLVRIALTR